MEGPDAGCGTTLRQRISCGLQEQTVPGEDRGECCQCTGLDHVNRPAIVFQVGFIGLRREPGYFFDPPHLSSGRAWERPRSPGDRARSSACDSRSPSSRFSPWANGAFTLVVSRALLRQNRLAQKPSSRTKVFFNEWQNICPWGKHWGERRPNPLDYHHSRSLCSGGALLWGSFRRSSSW